jgi:hypothetical protein
MAMATKLSILTLDERNGHMPEYARNRSCLTICPARHYPSWLSGADACLARLDIHSSRNPPSPHCHFPPYVSPVLVTTRLLAIIIQQKVDKNSSLSMCSQMCYESTRHDFILAKYQHQMTLPASQFETPINSKSPLISLRLCPAAQAPRNQVISPPYCETEHGSTGNRSLLDFPRSRSFNAHAGGD